MRVLILTKIFPNRREPLSSPFNRRQFSELGRLCDVRVLATIPWFPGASAFSKWSRAGRLVDVPRVDVLDGTAVEHPRFLFVPKLAPGLSGPLYAASLARAVLQHRERVDVILGSWAYPDGFAAVALAKLLGVPAVIKLHGSDVNVVARLPGPRRGLAWAFPHAARVVAVSRPLRDAAVALGAPPDRVDIVRNGVDRERFQPADRTEARRELGLPEDRPTLVCVSNVERHKGSVDLVRAYASLARTRPETNLVLVGDGAARSECEALARQLGLVISFVGPKPHREVPRWMAASDLVVLPSWNEGTPNVVLEALASGRRVVATRVGGTADVVSSEELGTLVPPREPEALARALEDALARPYDPVAVSNSLAARDWATSARELHASLEAACAA
jgi:glycosyltransferase involved in cell wall biosynthesis